MHVLASHSLYRLLFLLPLSSLGIFRVITLSLLLLILSLPPLSSLFFLAFYFPAMFSLCYFSTCRLFPFHITLFASFILVILLPLSSFIFSEAFSIIILVLLSLSIYRLLLFLLISSPRLCRLLVPLYTTSSF